MLFYRKKRHTKKEGKYKGISITDILTIMKLATASSTWFNEKNWNRNLKHENKSILLWGRMFVRHVLSWYSNMSKVISALNASFFSFASHIPCVLVVIENVLMMPSCMKGLVQATSFHRIFLVLPARVWWHACLAIEKNYIKVKQPTVDQVPPLPFMYTQFYKSKWWWDTAGEGQTTTTGTRKVTLI